VPPDYFSSQGQLWGNPVYDWNALRQADYRWWIARLRSLLSHVDVIRLDHFRGFSAAWHVPAGAPTAETGSWVPGPGSGFFQAVEKELGRLPFVAEDLGLITTDVSSMRDRLHLPGMRVLQFAFDGRKDNPHLPDNFHTNMLYTRVLMTTLRLAHGSMTCLVTNGRSSGITWKGEGPRAPMQQRR
jgi:4-alpha-glucanotransferase